MVPKLNKHQANCSPLPNYAAIAVIGSITYLTSFTPVHAQLQVSGPRPWQLKTDNDATIVNIGTPDKPVLLHTTVKGTNANATETLNLGVSPNVIHGTITVTEDVTLKIHQTGIITPQPSQYVLSPLPSSWTQVGGEWLSGEVVEGSFPIPSSALPNLKGTPAGQSTFSAAHFGQTSTVVINWHLYHENYEKDPNVQPKNPAFSWTAEEIDPDRTTVGVTESVYATALNCPEWLPESLHAISEVTETIGPAEKVLAVEIAPEYVALTEILGVAAGAASDNLKEHQTKHTVYGPMSTFFDQGLNRWNDPAHAAIVPYQGRLIHCHTVTINKVYGESYQSPPRYWFQDGSDIHYLPQDRGSYEITEMKLRRGIQTLYLMDDEYGRQGYKGRGKLAPEKQIKVGHLVGNFFLSGTPPATPSFLE